MAHNIINGINGNEEVVPKNTKKQVKFFSKNWFFTVMLFSILHKFNLKSVVSYLNQKTIKNNVAFECPYWINVNVNINQQRNTG